MYTVKKNIQCCNVPASFICTYDQLHCHALLANCRKVIVSLTPKELQLLTHMDIYLYTVKLNLNLKHVSEPFVCIL